MPLTLQSSLTSTVSRQVGAVSGLNQTLGASLTTGEDKDVGVIDGFLGNSLRSDEIIQSSLVKTASYGVNMLNVAEVYTDLIQELIRESMALIITAQGKAADKVAVLERNLIERQKQLTMLIDAAEYDGKKLLNGSVRNLAMQVGKDADNKIEMDIINIGNGKLFRSSLAKSYNEYLHTNYLAIQGDIPYYQNQGQINTDYRENKNLLQLAEKEAPYPGSGTGGLPSWANVANVWHAILNGPNGAQYAQTLNDAIPETLAALKNVIPADHNRDFSNATALEIGAALQATAIRNAAGNPRYYANEIKRIIYDNQPLSLSSPQDIVVAYDIFTGALQTIHLAQVQISSTKMNILSAVDALRVTTIVTEQAADSYLKTDYVEAANDYAQNLRSIVASVAALQASNQITDAAQILIEALAD